VCLCKLVCLSKPVNVSVNRKDTSLLQNLSIFINYESVLYQAQDMFCSFYLVKIHKIANNLATAKAREKISAYLESLQFKKNYFGLVFSKFKNNQDLLNKICH
jgi:hypothetical protein